MRSNLIRLRPWGLTLAKTDLQKFHEHLARSKDVQDLSVVSATIEGFEPFFGTRYRQIKSLKTKERMQVDHVERLHILGTLPSIFLNNDDENAVCLTMNGADWYVSQAFVPGQGPTSELQKTYNPFGANFILQPWAGSKVIDVALGAKYHRLSLVVQTIKGFPTMRNPNA